MRDIPGAWPFVTVAPGHGHLSTDPDLCMHTDADRAKPGGIS
ncbi:hypothetical protein [Streptomyces chryseus]